jgi:hypothetical protein
MPVQCSAAAAVVPRWNVTAAAESSSSSDGEGNITDCGCDPQPLLVCPQHINTEASSSANPAFHTAAADAAAAAVVVCQVLPDGAPGVKPGGEVRKQLACCGGNGGACLKALCAALCCMAVSRPFIRQAGAAF